MSNENNNQQKEVDERISDLKTKVANLRGTISTTKWVFGKLIPGIFTAIGVIVTIVWYLIKYLGN